MKRKKRIKGGPALGQTSLIQTFLIGVLLLPALILKADEKPRYLSLGQEISGKLDSQDRLEDEYRFSLRERRGLYRLTMARSEKGIYPEVCFSSAVLSEDMCLSPSLFQDPSFLLTLPAGEYVLMVSNEPEVALLPYRLRLDFVSPWNDSLEWEPNEEPNQLIAPGKKISGNVQGFEDEDRFLFSVRSDHPPAYDFRLLSDSPEPLLLRVEEETGEEKVLCQVGVRGQDGYLIRGLALDEGRYIVHVALNPLLSGSYPDVSALATKKQPQVRYELQILPNDRPFCTLVPEEDALRQAFQFSGEKEIREGGSPRLQLESKIYEASQRHFQDLFAEKRLLVLPRDRQKDTLLWPKVRKAVIEAGREGLRLLSESLREDPTLTEACLVFLRQFGSMDEARARAFSQLWPAWKDVPDDIASRVLQSPAALLLQRFVWRSRRVVEARLISLSGLLIASSELPSSLWAGESVIWKKAVSEFVEEIPGDIFWDESLQKWVLEVAFPIKKNNVPVGVLLLKSIQAVSNL